MTEADDVGPSAAAELRKNTMESRRLFHRTDIWMLVLLAVTLLFGVWSIRNAQSVTYDSVIFLRYARQLADHPFWVSGTVETDSIREWLTSHSPTLEVIAGNAQHPGYPVLVAISHELLEPWLPGSTATVWIRSAQAASLAGLLLLVLGTYFLFCEILDRPSALMAAALVAFSPPMIRVGADALSDAPAAAMLVWSAWGFARVLRLGGLATAFWAGAMSAVGYMIRPEAVQLAIAAIAFLSLRFLLGTRPRTSTALQIASVLLPILLVATPYVYLRGSPLTKKAYLVNAFQNETSETEEGEVVRTPEEMEADAVAAPVPEIRRPTWERDFATYGRGFVKFMMLWSALAGHIFLLPILLGFACSLPEICRRTDQRLLWFAALVNLVALPFLLFWLSGYLDIRHIIPTYLLTIGWCWRGCYLLAVWFRGALSGAWKLCSGTPIRWPFSASAGTIATVAGLFVVLSVVIANNRLNAQLAGFRDVGLWLEEHAGEKDYVLDPCLVGAFYANLDASNPWAYPGYFDFQLLVKHIRQYRQARYVVLPEEASRYLVEGKETVLMLGPFVLEEQLALQICPSSKKSGLVRVYRVHRGVATQPFRSRISSRQ